MSGDPAASLAGPEGSAAHEVETAEPAGGEVSNAEILRQAARENPNPRSPEFPKAWRDVTALVRRVSGGLGCGELLCSATYTAFDALSAMELGDRKMDPGFGHECAVSVAELFDSGAAPVSPTPAQVVAIMDELRCRHVQWWRSASLPQSLFECAYMVEPDRAGPAPLRAFVRLMLRHAFLESEVILRGDIFVEEDQPPSRFHYDYAGALGDDGVLAEVRAAEQSLAEVLVRAGRPIPAVLGGEDGGAGVVGGGADSGVVSSRRKDKKRKVAKKKAANKRGGGRPPHQPPNTAAGAHADAAEAGSDDDGSNDEGGAGAGAGAGGPNPGRQQPDSGEDVVGSSYAMLVRLRLARALFLLVRELVRPEAAGFVPAQKLVNEVLALADLAADHPDLPAPGFDSRLSMGFLPSCAVRKVQIPSRSEALAAVRGFASAARQLEVLARARSLEAVFDALWNMARYKNETVLRSLVAAHVGSAGSVLDLGPLEPLVALSVEAFAPSAVAGRVPGAADNYDEFLRLAAVATRQMLRLLLGNTSRQRRMVAKVVPDLELMLQAAADLDQLVVLSLRHAGYDVVSPAGRPGVPHRYPFTGWSMDLTSKALFLHAARGFELELYGAHEVEMVLFFMFHQTDTMRRHRLNCQTPCVDRARFKVPPLDGPRGSSSRRAQQPSTSGLVLEIEHNLCLGLLRCLHFFVRVGSFRRRKYTLGHSGLIFQHRFAHSYRLSVAPRPVTTADFEVQCRVDDKSGNWLREVALRSLREAVRLASKVPRDEGVDVGYVEGMCRVAEASLTSLTSGVLGCRRPMISFQLSSSWPAVVADPSEPAAANGGGGSGKVAN